MTSQRNRLTCEGGVSIILPTLASMDRREKLLRAVRSVLDASKGLVKAIVCVNGTRWDADSIAAVEALEGVELHRLPEPSLPKAIAYGRSVVTTPYFGFLDDDDQLLPGAIDVRLSAMLSNSNLDLVVTNGIRRSPAGDAVMLSGLQSVLDNPLQALFEQNWLPSCGALFRTSTVGQNYFDDYHEYAEWTWLAFRLANDGKRVGAIDEPYFIVNETSASLSKSSAYRHAYLPLYGRMLRLGPPNSVRSVILERMGAEYHNLSGDCLSRGEIWRGTRLHLHSLVLPRGLRYASYSRHIILAALTRLYRSLVIRRSG